MLNFNEFTEEVVAALQEKMGAGYHVQTRETAKNNGIARTALLVQSPESNVSPCIYLEGYYLLYRAGEKSFADLVNDIETAYRDHAKTEALDLSFFTEYSNVRERLCGKLINTEMNRDFLELVPHREYLDLSLVYMVSVPAGFFDCCGNVQIRNEHLRMWNVTEQELYEAVAANMEHDSTELKNIEEILAEMTDGEFDFNEDNTPKLYVAGKTDRVNGAVEMLNSRFLKEAAEFFAADYMILPSSIHELLFLPVSDTELDPVPLAEMVREVNDTQVGNDEILSYHVYRYNRHSGEVAIAA